MFRLAIKGGLATGAVYYTADQGVWKDSETTAELYNSIKSHACPYIKQATEQLPFSLPDIPNSSEISHIGRVYWNSGVKNVFAFTLDSPNYVSKWCKSAYESMESFVNTPAVASPDAKTDVK